jgi:hypothetical protein
MNGCKASFKDSLGNEWTGAHSDIVKTRMETLLSEFLQLNEMVAKNTAGLRSAVSKFSPYEQKDVESQQPNGPGALGELERQLHVLSDSARQLSEILKHLDTIV